MGKIRNAVRRIGRGFDRHSNAILTAASVTGVFTTIIPHEQSKASGRG